MEQNVRMGARLGRHSRDGRLAGAVEAKTHPHEASVLPPRI